MRARNSVTGASETATNRGPGVLLDHGTQLVEVPPHGYSLNVYIDAGEASAAFVLPRSMPDPEEIAQRLEDEDDTTEGASQWSMLSEEDRRSLNVHRATTRARGRLRRYAIRNKLTYLHTLTYRCVACSCDPCECGQKLGPATRETVKRHVATFIRALRDHRDLEPFAYAYVIERGNKSTQRLHVHLLLPFHLEVADGVGSAPIMASVWGRGRVDLRFRGGAAETFRDKARACARYLTKYLSKSLGDEDEAWAHSYERSQGFNVRCIKRARLTYADAVTLAAWLLEADSDTYLSDSENWTDYEGPPAFFMCLA